MATAAVRSVKFTASIGVNTHLGDTAGPYGRTAQVKSELDYIGVNYVRDLHPSSWNVSAFAALLNMGVTIDLNVAMDPGEELTHGGLQADISLINQLNSAAPGHIGALEGLNEPWRFPDLYNGQPTTDWGTVALAQMAEQAAVDADPALSGLPLLSPSVDPWGISGTPANFSADSDVGNAHVYPYAGLQPGAFIAAGLAGQQVLVGNKPVWITEFGYSNTPGDPNYGVDSATQAKNTLNGLLDAFKDGAARTFLYELLDEASNISPNTAWGALGLFNADGTPKPVAVALHNLSTILADTAANAATFQTGSLDFSIAGLPSTASDELFQKSDGTFELVVWNEAADWDYTTQSEVAVAATLVTVSTSQHWATESVFDPLVGASAISTSANANSVQLSLTDHPVILQLTPPPPTSAPVAVSNTPVAVSSPSITPITSQVSPTPPAAVAASGIYRFFDRATGTHFFTSSAAEAAAVETPGSATYRPAFVAEQNDFGALTPAAAQTDPDAVKIYRLFNTTDGVSFLTASASEFAGITQPGSTNYRPDLVAEPSATFYEHAAAAQGDVAVYRFFDTVHGTHLFVSSQAEFSSITTVGASGYRPDLIAEGVAFYAPAGSYMS